MFIFSTNAFVNDLKIPIVHHLVSLMNFGNVLEPFGLV